MASVIKWIYITGRSVIAGFDCILLYSTICEKTAEMEESFGSHNMTHYMSYYKYKINYQKLRIKFK